MTIGDHLEGIIAGTLWEKMNASERIWLAKVTALFMNRKETNT